MFPSVNAQSLRGSIERESLAARTFCCKLNCKSIYSIFLILQSLVSENKEQILVTSKQMVQAIRGI
jgi:hypothetical protein